MIGLTIAMLLAQEAPVDAPARCRSVALRLEGARLQPGRLDARNAGLPRSVRDAAFARSVREIRAARELAKVIRVRYPGAAVRDPQVEALAWETVMAEGRACRDGVR
jgi:hypothetical protein